MTSILRTTSISSYLPIVSNPFYLIHFIFLAGLIFLGNQRITWPLYDLLAFLFIFFSFKHTFKTKNNIESWLVMSLMGILLTLSMFNIILNGFTVVGILKLYNYFKHLFIILFFAYAMKNDIINLKKFFFICYWIVLIQFIFNISIMQQQFQEIGLINLDLVTGMFGEYASHLATFTWLFLLTMHLYMWKNKLLLIPLLVAMIYLSAITASRTFIVFSTIPILIYFFPKFKLRYFFITIITISGLIVAAYFTYLNIPEVKKFADKDIIRVYNIYTGIESKTIDTRAKVVSFTLKNTESFILGKGPGTMSEVFGFEGKYVNIISEGQINDMGVMLFEMGLAFYILFNMLYAMLLNSFFPGKSVLRFLFILIIILFINYYTQLYSSIRGIYPFMLLVIFLGMMSKEEQTYEDLKTV